jgi:hypothetical protein
MKLSENDKKVVRELVNLYFLNNPQNNKGMGFRTKTWDIITSYYTKHNMSKEDIEHCIESSPMCKLPIWDQFYNYKFKNENKNNIEESGKYKKSVDESLDPSDWV